MNTRLKTPELLEAQVGGYLASFENFGEKALLFSYFEDVLTASPKDGFVCRGETPSDIFTNTAEVSYKPYLDQLRSDQQGRDTRLEVADLLKNYDYYSEYIDELLTSDDSTSAHLIGFGHWSDVYKIDRGDQSYAVKIPRSGEVRPGRLTVHEKLTAGVVAKDIQGLEQIFAGSYKKGVIIAEYFPGKPIDDWDEATMKSVSRKQIEELLQAVKTAAARGIRFDYNPDNLMYQPEHGFKIIDYSYAGTTEVTDNYINGIVATFRHRLTWYVDPEAVPNNEP